MIQTNARVLALLATSLLAAGCTLPWQRAHSDSSTATSSAAGNPAECESLREQIKDSRETERQAPTRSVNEDIVAASQAKADKRIEELQAQFDVMGCSAADLPSAHSGAAPLPAAPGGLPH